MYSNGGLDDGSSYAGPSTLSGGAPASSSSTEFSKAKKRRPSVSTGTITPDYGQQTSYPVSPVVYHTAYNQPRFTPHPFTPPSSTASSSSSSFLSRITTSLPSFLSSPATAESPSAGPGSAAGLRRRSISRADSPDSLAYRSGRPKRRRKRDSPWLGVLNGGWGLNWSSLLRVLAVAAIVIALLFRYLWELQFEFSIYHRPWVQKEILSLEHPRDLDLQQTCFRTSASALSNWNFSSPTSHHPSHVSFQSTLGLTHSFDCLAFTHLIQPSPLVSSKPTYYHTYWRSDLLPFIDRQAYTVKSFLATQPLAHSTLILWANGAAALINRSPLLRELLMLYPQNFEVREMNVWQLAKGTALEGNTKLLGVDGNSVMDERAWVDGDLVRLLVLWNIGGIWADMDMIFVRNLHVLTEDEWVTQWDCYDKPYQSLNGALLHFHSHSPYLCSFLTLISLSAPAKPASTDWGSLLYLRTFRRLLNQGIVPFQVLPWCFSDPRNCRTDKRFPDPFQSDPSWWAGKRWNEGGEDELRRHLDWQGDRGIFTLHLHNQWSKEFPRNGWVRRLLLDPMDAALSERRERERSRELPWKGAAEGAVGGEGGVPVP